MDEDLHRPRGAVAGSTISAIGELSLARPQQTASPRSSSRPRPPPPSSSSSSSGARFVTRRRPQMYASAASSVASSSGSTAERTRQNWRRRLRQLVAARRRSASSSSARPRCAPSSSDAAATTAAPASPSSAFSKSHRRLVITEHRPKRCAQINAPRVVALLARGGGSATRCGADVFAGRGSPGGWQRACAPPDHRVAFGTMTSGCTLPEHPLRAAPAPRPAREPRDERWRLWHAALAASPSADALRSRSCVAGSRHECGRPSTPVAACEGCMDATAQPPSAPGRATRRCFTRSSPG